MKQKTCKLLVNSVLPLANPCFFKNKHTLCDGEVTIFTTSNSGSNWQMRVYKVDYLRTARKKSSRTNTHKLINKAVANIQAVEKGMFGVEN